jgi:formylglycine-generating enzyme required for sulfatase activity
MGTAGKLNDNADITAPVFSYVPNDYGLYNMGGNVAEWVMDVYRPLSHEDANDFNAYRGNVYKTQVTDDEGAIAEKDSLGRVQYRDVSEDEASSRRNYKKADNIAYLDGDEPEYANYSYGSTSLINDKSRVYKGGSWKDRAYYMTPGTRRYLDEDQATDYIGFRCAMSRVGSPVGLGGKKNKK